MVFAGIPAVLASRPIVSAWAIACLPVLSGALTIDLPVAGRSSAFRGTLDAMGDIDELTASQPLAVGRGMVARRGRHLQYLTVIWNSAECIVALAAGFLAGSIALVGFGFDSAIEVTSSLAALWRLRSDAVERDRERAEGRTLRIIGVCFMLLAGYVLYNAIRTLLTREPPSVSTAGIIITGLSLIVMPILVGAKRRVAASLQSSALEA